MFIGCSVNWSSSASAAASQDQSVYPSCWSWDILGKASGTWVHCGHSEVSRLRSLRTCQHRCIISTRKLLFYPLALKCMCIVIRVSHFYLSNSVYFNLYSPLQWAKRASDQTGCCDQNGLNKCCGCAGGVAEWRCGWMLYVHEDQSILSLSCEGHVLYSCLCILGWNDGSNCTWSGYRATAVYGSIFCCKGESILLRTMTTITNTVPSLFPKWMAFSYVK